MHDTIRTSRPSIPRTVGTDAERRTARNALIEWRRSMPRAQRDAADAAIRARVDALVDELAGALVDQLDGAVDAASTSALGVYWPVRGEPDLRESMRRWHAAGRALGLPRVVAPRSALAFGRWTPEWELREAVFGVPVPEPFERLQPTLLILPCVGFDARGYRLGYGGGYYDCTLAARSLPAIGVAYDACEIGTFVAAAHDRPLSAIVTETRTIVLA